MGISIWQLVIVLVIVLLLFGTKKLRNAGGDVGGAIRNFKNAMKTSPKEDEATPEKLEKPEDIIEGEASRDRDRAS